MNCTSIQEYFPDLVDDSDIQIVLSVSYWTIFFLGFLGNTIALLLIFQHHVSRLVHGVYITSLTISTLLLVIASLPITAVQIFLRTWPLGYVGCKFLPFLQSANVFAISLILCAIAADRYFLIVRPFRSGFKPNAYRLTVCVWVLSALLASPYMLTLETFKIHTEDNNNVCGEFCDEKWPNEKLRKTFGVSVIVIQFGGPLFFFMYCYGMISREVRRQVQKRLASSVLMAGTQAVLQKRRQRVNKMICRLILSFVLPWLPLHFLYVARDFEFLGYIFDNKWDNLAVAVAHCLAMTTCVWNPIVYAFYHPDLKRFFLERFSGKWCFTDMSNLPTSVVTYGSERTRFLSETRITPV